MHTLTLSVNWTAIVSEDGRRIVFECDNLHVVTIPSLAWAMLRPTPIEVGSGLRRGNTTHCTDGGVFTVDVMAQTMTVSKGDLMLVMDAAQIEALYHLRERVLHGWRQASRPQDAILSERAPTGGWRNGDIAEL